MKKTKRLLAILACLALLVSVVAACGGNNNDAKETQGGGNTQSGGATGGDASGGDASGGDASGGDASGGEDTGRPVSAKDSVVVAITEDRGTLNPFFLQGYELCQALRLVYQPLWEFDDTYTEMKFVLAESLDMTDPLKWVVKLREDVTFANGNPFTADDALFSLWLANNRSGEPPFFTNMDNEANRKIDDYTFEIVWTQFSVVSQNSFATIFMLDEESYNEETIAFETNGTGAYVITDYTINSAISLTHRDGYWGEYPPIKNITFKVLAEAAQRVNALETGEIDICPVPFLDVEYVKTMSNTTVLETPTRGQVGITLNCTNPDRIFYDNMDARLAVFYAIDAQAIKDIVYGGYGHVARGWYSSFCSDAKEADFDLGIYKDGYNPELAKQLAESSGLTEVELVLINHGAADAVMLSEVIQQMCKEVGINIKIQSTDAGSWLQVRFANDTHDIATNLSSGNPSVVDMSVWWRYCANAAAYGYPIGSERMQELTDQVLQISDLKEREAYQTEMVAELNKLNLFKALVDMIGFSAYNSNLVLPRNGGNWIDWPNAYWTA